MFSVQRAGFDLCISEVENYLENLERARADGLNDYPDEIIMNALAVREKERVAVISDYHYNFLAYYLKHDPSWLWQGKIVHFHSLKPYSFCSTGEAIKFRGFAEAGLVNEDLYLAVLLWARYLHSACRQLAFDFPMLAALPQALVDRSCRGCWRSSMLGCIGSAERCGVLLISQFVMIQEDCAHAERSAFSS